MSLLEMAQESLARLKKIEAARDGVEEAKSLEDLRSELDDLAAPLKQLASNTRVLRKEGVTLSSTTEISVTIDKVKDIAMRFSEAPKSTTLRQGTRWTGLTNKLDGLAMQVRESQTNDWHTFFKGLFSGADPEQRRATLDPTPDNNKMLKRYSELFQSVIRYKTQIPKDADEFKTLRELSEQLAQIKFQEDVPADVRKFFAATTSGAGLDLLTNEVLSWLRNNNLLGSYVVRAKIN